jgi:hypothetical protein
VSCCAKGEADGENVTGGKKSRDLNSSCAEISCAELGWFSPRGDLPLAEV